MGLYVGGASVLHRPPASVKFLLLFLILAGAFLVENLYAPGGILLFSLLVYPVAAQMLFTSLQRGAVSGIRLLVAVLLASLLTYTTRSSDMLDFFGRMREPLVTSS